MANTEDFKQSDALTLQQEEQALIAKKQKLEQDNVNAFTDEYKKIVDKYGFAFGGTFTVNANGGSVGLEILRVKKD